MRKINAKQLLAIAVCGLALVSCGGGGAEVEHLQQGTVVLDQVMVDLAMV